jgi:hypothetical protein
MPSWCLTKLTISGDDPELQRFRDAHVVCKPNGSNATHGDLMGGAFLADSNEVAMALDLNTIIPMPADLPIGEEIALSDGTKIGTMSDAERQWKADNWGTKWNPRIEDSEAKPGSLELFLRTPWGPPIPCLNKLVEMCPGLRFEGDSIYECDHYDRWVPLQKDGLVTQRAGSTETFLEL